MLTAIDLFAGAGGSTTGAQMAGIDVIWAANHWRVAVDCHAANHPDTDHICQDLNLFPSCDMPDHDVLLASPSCKGFSPARGKDRAHHDIHRATAWIVIDALEAKRPPVAVVENVVEMRKWALYPAWLEATRILGYSVNELVIDAADCGVPQNRERLFLVLSKSKYPLPISLEKQPHRPVSDVLEWETGRWSPIHKQGRSRATLQRIQNAAASGLGERFLIPYYGSGSGKTGRCVNRPVGTLTTKARWALVNLQRSRMRMMSPQEAKRAMGFPSSYCLPKTVHAANAVLGNAVCPPVMRDILLEVRKQI